MTASFIAALQVVRMLRDAYDTINFITKAAGIVSAGVSWIMPDDSSTPDAAPDSIPVDNGFPLEPLPDQRDRLGKPQPVYNSHKSS